MSHEQLDQRTYTERVQQRSDSHVAAQQPTRRHHCQFDAGPNEPDGQARSRDESCHQAVARTWSHSGTDVERRRERVHDDAGEQQCDPKREPVDIGKPAECDVHRDRDDNDVADSSQPRLLAQWNPRQQYQNPGQCGDRPEAQR